MNPRVGGTRPRPRVALLGNFDLSDLERYEQLFPTVWSAPTIKELEDKVHVGESDLLVIAPGLENASGWPVYVHVICFSKDIKLLPGPIPYSEARIFTETETEQFLLPDLPLSFNRRREADFGQLNGVRGWPELGLSFVVLLGHSISDEDCEVAWKVFKDGAIISDYHTNRPLATIYLRVDSNLGVAWLPHHIFSQVAWVELIAADWAQSDRESFPAFGDWRKRADWMVPQEEQLVARIKALEDEKSDTIARIDQEIGCLSTKLAEVTLATDKGRRRLLTAQGDELVEEVVAVFREFRFKVQLVDKSLDPSLPRREDLRLQDPSGEDDDWEAIVEVRGYKRSAGTTADLLRLARFADLYRNEKGRLPDKRLYVVNGQLELQPPSQRQEPLASASEDIEIFAENNGAVISTIDLFRAAKVLKQQDYVAIRDCIKRAEGRWTFQSVRGTSEN